MSDTKRPPSKILCCCCLNGQIETEVFFSLFRYGVAFTYYGISLNITGFGLNPYLTQFVFASIEMPMKIGVYFFLEKVGRRPGQTLAMLLTGLCLFINVFVAEGIFFLFFFFFALI